MPDKYKGTSSLCPIIYQEGGSCGSFTKSYSVLDEALSQKGGRQPLKVPSPTQNTPDAADVGQKKMQKEPVTPNIDLRSCLHRLDVIARTKDPRRRRTLLRELSQDDTITHTLQFLARNTINRRIPLERHHKQKLIKHCKVIQDLAKQKISKARIKKLVEQSGGFLPVLVPLAIELVSDLIQEYV